MKCCLVLFQRDYFTFVRSSCAIVKDLEVTLRWDYDLKQSTQSNYYTYNTAVTITFLGRTAYLGLTALPAEIAGGDPQEEVCPEQEDLEGAKGFEVIP